MYIHTYVAVGEIPIHHSYGWCKPSPNDGSTGGSTPTQWQSPRHGMLLGSTEIKSSGSAPRE